MTMRCNKDCLNCSLPKCKHDIEDEKELINEIVHKRKLENTRRYNARHREELKVKHRAWYEAHREEHNVKAKARYWRLKNERRNIGDRSC